MATSLKYYPLHDIALPCNHFTASRPFSAQWIKSSASQSCRKFHSNFFATVSYKARDHSLIGAAGRVDSSVGVFGGTEKCVLLGLKMRILRAPIAHL